MAEEKIVERYEMATIDISDMTLTEYKRDWVGVHDLNEILKRWNNVPGITFTIEVAKTIHPTGEVCSL